MSRSAPTLHFVVAFLLCSQTVAAPSAPTDQVSDKLLLMMFDGMRWDSVNDDLPGMKQMKEHGVHADHLIPCYPTLSLPNHLCILTGLYSENHGLIENALYDESLDETLTIVNMTQRYYRDSKWWEHVEPIWSAAAKQGKRVKVYHWRASEIKMNGFRLKPDQLEMSDEVNMYDVQHLEKTVHEVLKKLANDELDFAVMYVGDPDHTQHFYGFGSLPALKVIHDLDNVVLRLQQDISMLTMTDGKTKLSDKLNFMLVSDHGHMNYSQDGGINVTNLLSHHDIKHALTSGPQLEIWPKDNTDEIIRDLEHIPSMKVYRRKDIPERWHYKNSPYTPPVLAVLEPGFFFIAPDQRVSGHGYDNNVTEMQAIFLARGPHFKSGKPAEPLENVHLYQIMCSILGIKPSPNDGTVSAVRPFVVDLFNLERLEHEAVSFNSVIMTAIIALSSVLILTGILCVVRHIKRRERTEHYKTLLPSEEQPSEDEEDEI